MINQATIGQKLEVDNAAHTTVNAANNINAAIPSTQSGLLAELEKGEFKNFLDAFYKVYQNSKRTNDTKDSKEETEILEALKKFNILLFEEMKRVALNPDLPLDKTPCIKLARSHLPILFFSLDDTSSLFVWKKPEAEKKIISSDPTKLYKHLAWQFCHIPESTNLMVPIAVIIFPELKAKPEVLLEITTNFHFIDHYLYYKSLGIQISIKLKHEILVLLLNNFKQGLISTEVINNERLTSSRYLNFFFSLKIHLEVNQYNNFQWFQHFPWEAMTSGQIFLFEYLADEQAQILKYLNDQYPNLVYHHLLRGNFFIAEQFIEFGLKEPTVSIEQFLNEAISAGLTNSKELQKYHGILLLAYQLGLISINEAAALLPDLFDTTQVGKFQKLALEILPKVIAHYLKTHNDEIPTLKREHYKKINQLMLVIERDYAIAISTIYNLPILYGRTDHSHKQHIKCYRSLTLPNTKLNTKLMRYWRDFGHRADIYSFFGHAYNHAAKVAYERGTGGKPFPLSWGVSDSTRISPSAEGALGYLRSSLMTENFLLSFAYPEGQPIFLGNLRWAPDEDIRELEMPVCIPSSMEGVYRVSDAGVEEAIYAQGVSKEHAILREGKFDAEAVKQIEKLAATNKTLFNQSLAPHRQALVSFTFDAYFGKYQVNNLFLSFRRNLFAFGSMRERFTIIIKNLNSLDTAWHPASNPTQTTLEYLFEYSSINKKLIEDQLNYTLTEIDNVSKGTHQKVAAELKAGTLEGEQIIQFISRHYPIIGKLFSSTAQVGEGYTVAEHTKMVFARLKEHQALPQYQMTLRSISRVVPSIHALFPVCIALHDIGKSIGNKDDQAKHTLLILEKLLSLWDFSQAEIIFARLIFGHDLLGCYFQNCNEPDFGKQAGLFAHLHPESYISPEQKMMAFPLLVIDLKNNAKKLKGLIFKDYFYLQMLYYLSDMGSYPGLYERLTKPSPLLSPYNYVVLYKEFQSLTYACQWHLPLYDRLADSVPVLFRYNMEGVKKSEVLEPERNSVTRTQHPFDIILDYCGDRPFEFNEELIKPNPRMDLVPNSFLPDFSRKGTPAQTATNDNISGRSSCSPLLIEIEKGIYLKIEFFSEQYRSGEKNHFLAAHLKVNDQWRTLNILDFDRINTKNDNNFDTLQTWESFNVSFEDDYLQAINSSNACYSPDYSVTVNIKNPMLSSLTLDRYSRLPHDSPILANSPTTFSFDKKPNGKFMQKLFPANEVDNKNAASMK